MHFKKIWMAVLFAALLTPFNGTLAQEALKIPLGKGSQGLHIADNDDDWVEARPGGYDGLDDYNDMMFQVCRAMELSFDNGECDILPFVTQRLSSGALATKFAGEKLIIYNRTLSPEVGYTGAFGIIAHEVGHHFCRHLGKAGGHDIELEADRFAGAAMRLSNLSLRQALAMAVVFGNRPTQSHPSRQQRAEAIRQGWQDPASAKQCR